MQTIIASCLETDLAATASCIRDILESSDTKPATLHTARNRYANLRRPDPHGEADAVDSGDWGTGRRK